jgi:hypothetical protein
MVQFAINLQKLPVLIHMPNHIEILFTENLRLY